MWSDALLLDQKGRVLEGAVTGSTTGPSARHLPDGPASLVTHDRRAHARSSTALYVTDGALAEHGAQGRRVDPHNPRWLVDLEQWRREVESGRHRLCVAPVVDVTDRSGRG